MSATLFIQVPQTSDISATRRRELIEEVRINGLEQVVSNRRGRAELLKKRGDEEFAQKLLREVKFLEDIYKGT